MPNIPQVRIGNTTYDIKDNGARDQIEGLKSAIVNGGLHFQSAKLTNGYIYSSGAPTGHIDNDYRAYTTVMQVSQEDITVKVNIPDCRAVIYYYSGEIINSQYKQSIHEIGTGRTSMELTIPANQHFAFYVFMIGNQNPLAISTAEKIIIVESSLITPEKSQAITKGIDDVKNCIVNGQMLFTEANFDNGCIYSSGNPSGHIDNDFRAYTTKIQKFPFEIKMRINGRHRAAVYFYSDALMVAANLQSSYMVGYGSNTTELTIPANQYFGFHVYRENDSSNPLPISEAENTAYYKSYFSVNSPDNINIRYNDRKDALTQLTRLPMFLIYTDIHGFKDHLDRIAEFYNNNCKDSCKDVICLGDIVYDRISNSTEILNTDFGKHSLLTIGNHDCYDGTTIGGPSKSEVYNKFFTNVALWQVTQPANASTNYKMYYYKDYDNNIRLVVLDEYYWDADELTWFESVLSSARSSGLSVIVAQHQVNYTDSEYTPLTNNAFFTDEISWVRTTPGYQDRRNAVDAFINDGGKFVCWINGHTHFEYCVTFETTHAKQLSLTFSNAGADETSRVRINGYSQDCFYYLAVDTELKYIYVLTIGQAENKWGKRNLMLVYDYGNHVVKQYY